MAPFPAILMNTREHKKLIYIMYLFNHCVYELLLYNYIYCAASVAGASVAGVSVAGASVAGASVVSASAEAASVLSAAVVASSVCSEV